MNITEEKPINEINKQITEKIKPNLLISLSLLIKTVLIMQNKKI
ncbi:heme exporter B domain protein [Rickettsia felis str. Pedreira]|uniref:Heme exporter B domain protein n=1 Tax=Rickettsia felis str. Pedreira TaxID=1359196 RepID=A0A0F3MTA9_RICFI|nr:heme exporter B domain protein [Rickettsia felis str. Pedreira]